LSLRPGTGSVEWPGIIAGLAAAGCLGSFDIEIICPSETVRQPYREGRVFIETILNRIEAGSESSDLPG
jgi:sugar phosphate isomerase/epimerase